MHYLHLNDKFSSHPVECHSLLFLLKLTKEACQNTTVATRIKGNENMAVHGQSTEFDANEKIGYLLLKENETVFYSHTHLWYILCYPKMVRKSCRQDFFEKVEKILEKEKKERKITGIRKKKGGKRKEGGERKKYWKTKINGGKNEGEKGGNARKRKKKGEKKRRGERKKYWKKKEKRREKMEGGERKKWEKGKILEKERKRWKKKEGEKGKALEKE